MFNGRLGSVFSLHSLFIGGLIKSLFQLTLTSNLKELNTLAYNPLSKNLKNKIKYKDYDIEKLKLKVPEIKSLLNEIRALAISTKKYLTVDYQELNVQGDKTNSCRDLGWHIDGIDNQYFLVCWGDKPTQFLNESLVIECDSYTPQILNPRLKSKITSNDFQELNSGVLYQYDSQSIHRGRELTQGDNRILLRFCYSDYIKPTNTILT